MKKNILEVPVYSVEAALIAQNGGADRIELCAGFNEGGITPSYSMIKLAKKLLNVPLNIMIRPRGGDFVYSEMEFEQMKSDVEFCREIGVTGVVFGILRPDGYLDTERCKGLISLSGNMTTTLHRAFDMAKEPLLTLEQAIEIGFNTILTSGQQSTAKEGISLLFQLVEKAQNRIVILPGCGVNSSNIDEIKQNTKAVEFHASAKANIESSMVYRNPDVKMGNSGIDEYSLISIDINEVKKLKDILG